MKLRLTRILCLALGIILCGAILAEVFLYSQNTLVTNGNWRATKRDLQMSLMGADEFLVTRSSLAGNTLDLGSWHGYQEVLLRKSGEATELQFKFRIPENSYLDVLLDKHEGNYSGIRLSRSATYPSAHFLSDREGRFLSTKPTSFAEIGPGWHHALLKLGRGGVSFQIDQRHLTLVEASFSGSFAFGLRAGFAGALVDDVAVKYANGTSIADSFRNGEGWLKFTALFSLILAVVFSLVIFLLLKAIRWQEAAIMNGSILVAVQLSLCLSIYHAFDFYYWSKLPFQTDMRLLTTGEAVPQLPFERYRASFFKSWSRLMASERYPQDLVLKQYRSDRIFRGPIFCGADGKACTQGFNYTPASRGKKCLRFMLIGTSQSVGAGANTLEQSFFVRIHRGLGQRMKDQCVESLNLSISASNLEELTSAFNEQIDFAPDIVVVNLSNNDPAPGFYERLRHFVEINRKIQAQVLFVLEPNSADTEYTFGLKDKHETMRKVGVEMGIETYSMHDQLAAGEIMRAGQVWWDIVHLSSFGQSLAAEWLLPKLLALAHKRPPRP